MCTSPTVTDLKCYDVVVNATGVSSYVPDVHGMKDRVVPFEEAMACPKVSCEFYPKGRKPRKLEGTKVVVWGDHCAAVDTATYLASIGKEVTIVTDREEFAASVEVLRMYVTWKRFRQTDAEALSSTPYRFPVTVHQGCMIEEIREKEIVLVDKDFARIVVACDSIVTCWTSPNIGLLKELQAAGAPVVNVGDSVSPRNLHAAVREGARAGLMLDGAMLVNPNGALMDEVPMDVRGQLAR
jgi:thioredoxin reductase